MTLNPGQKEEVAIPIPAVDPITSDYGQKYMLTKFTLAFIRFVNGKFLFHYGYDAPNQKLAYATEVYRIVYSMPFLPIISLEPPIDDDVRKTLAFYLDSPFNLTFLESTLPDKKPFVEKLINLQYAYNNETRTLTRSEALSFLADVEKRVNESLEKFFTDANLASLQKKPKTDENPYYTVDAGIVLEAEAIAVLDKIGPLYFAKVGKKFNVNSGTRDAYRQAEAMWVKYPKDKTFSEYPQRKLVDEIREAIRQAQSSGKSNAGIIQAMTDVIQNQINRKEYISVHLIAGCIDIATQPDIPTGVAAMSGSEQKIMLEIAIKVTGGTAKKENNPPHIHIQFK